MTTNRMAPGQSSEAGDRPSFEQLVNEHGGTLYSLGLRFCGDRTQAEDMVQEVFLQAFRAWDGFEGRSSVKTWLYTIAARACQRMHRKKSGEPERIGSLDELLPFGESLVATIPGNEDEAATLQIRKEARQRLESAIVSLPTDFRVPLILKEIVGLSIHEVAEILGLAEGTVRSRVHRARLKLRKAMEEALPKVDLSDSPPVYSVQTCLDLLSAKQEALDRNVPFDSTVLCEKCKAVFATLDLAHDACLNLAQGDLPGELRERVMALVEGDQ
jgi:RNA polymerase sigma-70 factor, ECF subfamily